MLLLGGAKKKNVPEPFQKTLSLTRLRRDLPAEAQRCDRLLQHSVELKLWMGCCELANHGFCSRHFLKPKRLREHAALEPDRPMAVRIGGRT